MWADPDVRTRPRVEKDLAVMAAVKEQARRSLDLATYQHADDRIDDLLDELHDLIVPLPRRPVA